jgi:hypothetical protein
MAEKVQKKQPDETANFPPRTRADLRQDPVATDAHLIHQTPRAKARINSRVLVNLRMIRTRCGVIRRFFAGVASAFIGRRASGRLGPPVSTQGYRAGFLVVPLGPQQLIKEGTLMGILPLLAKRNFRTMFMVARGLSIVRFANLLETAIFHWAIA